MELPLLLIDISKKRKGAADEKTLEWCAYLLFVDAAVALNKNDGKAAHNNRFLNTDKPC